MAATGTCVTFFVQLNIPFNFNIGANSVSLTVLEIKKTLKLEFKMAAHYRHLRLCCVCSSQNSEPHGLSIKFSRYMQKLLCVP